MSETGDPKKPEELQEPADSDRGPSAQRRMMTYEMVERGPLLSRDRIADAGTREIDDPDRELVARWQAGDDAAFEALVRRHESRVYRLLLRMMGSPEEAEDVAQETFLNLHRHGRRFRGEARFSTFVYRVAANAALNRRRSLGRRRARIEKLIQRQAAGDDLPTTPRNPEDATLGSELSLHVREALDKLSPSLRMPVVLYDLEGLAYGEIAEVLGVAEGTVKSRIHRARKALRDELRGVLGKTGDGAES